MTNPVPLPARRNAAYEVGFSTDAASYAEAYHRLFDRLDWLETRLATKRYLVGDTIDVAQIKAHYYEVHRQLNPSGIVPLGPNLSGWASFHGRETLGGQPFGDGTEPPPADPDELPAPGSNPVWSAVTSGSDP